MAVYISGYSRNINSCAVIRILILDKLVAVLIFKDNSVLVRRALSAVGRGIGRVARDCRDLVGSENCRSVVPAGEIIGILSVGLHGSGRHFDRGAHCERLSVADLSRAVLGEELDLIVVQRAVVELAVFVVVNESLEIADRNLHGVEFFNKSRFVSS